MPKGSVYRGRSGNWQMRYSVLAESDADYRISQYLQENGLGELEDSTFTPEQAAFVLGNIEQVKTDVSRDYFEYEETFAQDKLLPIARIFNPDYQSIPVREQIARRELSKALLDKVNRHEAERSLATFHANMAARAANGQGLEREEQIMLNPRFDPDAQAENTELATLLHSGKPDDRRRAYWKYLQKVAGLADRISEIDIMDDRAFVEHYEDLRPIVSAGGEIVNVLRTAEELHIDLSGREFRPMIEKLAVVSEYATMARVRTDAICHPSYSQLDMHQLADSFADNQGLFVQSNGETVTYSDIVDARLGYTDEAQHYASTINQTNIQGQAIERTGVLFDRKLPLQKRVAYFKANYWETPHEMQPRKQPKNDPLRNGTDQSLPADPQARHDFLKAKFMTNLEIIKTVIPDFSMTDEEIEQYISADRIAMQQRELADKKTEEKLIKQYPTDTFHVPGPFRRNFYAILDKSGTEEGKAYNRSVAKLIGSPSREGDIFRKNLLCDILNAVQALDVDQMRGVPFDDRVRYAQKYRDLAYLGFENQHMIDVTGKDLKLALSAEASDHLKKSIKENCVELGGVGDGAAALPGNEYFLTMPFLHLTDEQKETLLGVADQLEFTGKQNLNEKREWTPRNNWSNFSGKAGNAAREIDYEDGLPPRVYTPDDFTDTMPKFSEMRSNLDEYRTQIRELYKALREEDIWYNWNNSDEYKNLLKALKESNEAVTALDGGADPAQFDRLSKSIHNVWTNADRYIRHVGDTPKNDRQANRLHMAKQLSRIGKNAQYLAYELEKFVYKRDGVTPEEQKELTEALQIVEEYRQVKGTTLNPEGKPEQEKKTVSPEEYLRSWQNSAEKLRENATTFDEDHRRVAKPGMAREYRLAELGLAAVKNARYYLDPAHNPQPRQDQRMSETETACALGVYQMYANPVESRYAVPLNELAFAKLNTQEGGMSRVTMAAAEFSRTGGKDLSLGALREKLGQNKPIFSEEERQAIFKAAKQPEKQGPQEQKAPAQKKQALPRQ